MAFSFVCHTALLPAYKELRQRSKQRMQSVANTGLSICYSLYLVVSIFAYVTYLGDTEKSILDNPPNKAPTIQVLKLCFVFAVVLTVPVIHFPFRVSLLCVLGDSDPMAVSTLRHVVVTTATLLVVLALAIFVPSIQDVFAVVGATSSVSIMAILPGIFYLKLTRDHPPSKSKTVAYCLVAVGVLLGTTSLSAVIYLFANPHANSS